MRLAFISMAHYLRLLCAMSMLWLLTSVTVSAHEVTPTIADLTVEDGTARLDLRLNIEAFLAGIDLDEVEDTDDTEGSDTYDAFRAMDAATLEDALAPLLERWADALKLTADGAAVPLSLESTTIPEIGNVELPRASQLVLTGDVPDGSASLSLDWPDGDGDLVLRQQGVEEPYTGYIDGGASSGPIALKGGGAQSWWGALVSYIPVGFDHILPKGLDHILFVLGLFFLSTQLRPLIWQVSAFTLAHTVTLALGALGVVTVSGAIVEPLIAASIVYVAVENIFSKGLSPWRPVVIFAFGLLHGLGFASVLGEFGLPEGQFIPALIGFNVGVEFGQLTVILLAFLAVGLWFRRETWYRNRIAIPASILIALVGAYWFVERVFF
jgi:hypothetical protein